MKVLVINGSPKGTNSITLQTVLFIREYHPACSFEILDAGQKIRSYEKDFSECEKKLMAADLILFSYPVYTFLVPSQLHRFIELIKEHDVQIAGKYACQITTSKHFYDVTAHRFIKDNCDDLGLKYIGGLSADMEDLLKKKGQKEAFDFFRYVLWSYEHGLHEPACCHKQDFRPEQVTVPAEDVRHTLNRRIVIVTDLSETDQILKDMICRFRRLLKCESTVVNLREFPFAGGCLGCFRCAADGTCVYKDGFDSFLRENIQSADGIVYAFTAKDHSMGSLFKMYDDRQFCNGHRTVTMGKPIGYLLNGDPDKEMNLKMVMEARSQAGGNFHAGIASSAHEADEEIGRLARVISYALENDYEQPQDFYGVGGMKIFRDLIWQMQGLMREDHRFYKEHGFYDFPQKRAGMTAAMYAVGAMMRNEKLNRMIGGKMTEGMVMPYKNVIAAAGKKQRK